MVTNLDIIYEKINSNFRTFFFTLFTLSFLQWPITIFSYTHAGFYWPSLEERWLADQHIPPQCTRRSSAQDQDSPVFHRNCRFQWNLNTTKCHCWHEYCMNTDFLWEHDSEYSAATLSHFVYLWFFLPLLSCRDLWHLSSHRPHKVCPQRPHKMVDQPLREADGLSDGPIMKKTGTKLSL